VAWIFSSYCPLHLAHLFIVKMPVLLTLHCISVGYVQSLHHVSVTISIHESTACILFNKSLLQFWDMAAGEWRFVTPKERERERQLQGYDVASVVNLAVRHIVMLRMSSAFLRHSTTVHRLTIFRLRRKKQSSSFVFCGGGDLGQFIFKTRYDAARMKQPPEIFYFHKSDITF